MKTNEITNDEIIMTIQTIIEHMFIDDETHYCVDNVIHIDVTNELCVDECDECNANMFARYEIENEQNTLKITFKKFECIQCDKH